MADSTHTALDRALSLSTEAQLEAIHSTARQLAIVASAGSGKTRVLTLRTAYRASEGTLDPSKTLVATFSRKAADELRHRLFRLGVRDLTCGTIHSVALRLLNDQRSALGRPPVELLIDRSRVIAQAMGSLGISGVTPAALETEIAWAKARLLDPATYEAIASTSGRQTPLQRADLARVFSTYETLKRQQGRLDLDDLLSHATSAISTNEAFRAAVAWRFRHIALDETQDLNPAQLGLILAICGDDPDLTFVGDPNQSIYGWNGSDASLMADLTARFPSTQTVYLRSNKRSSRHIVDAANAALGASGLVIDASDRGAPPTITRFANDDDEAETIALQLWRNEFPAETLSGVAILARTNAQLQTIANALDAASIPYRFAGAELAPASDVRASTKSGSFDEPASAVDQVTLSTFHRSKGLEWKTVYLVGLADGLVPYKMARTHEALAEEQRLFYVALTRATDALHLSWAERPSAMTEDHRRRGPSRWLEPIEVHLAKRAREDAPLEKASRLERLRAIRASIDAAPREAN
jgi:DNA helicase-2/ATP-dependent DNA helicase PcrA